MLAEDPGHRNNDAGELNERAAQYERWVSTVLRSTLEDYQERIAKVEEESGHYEQLKSKLTDIMSREEQGPLEMLTDLGADCYTRVKIPDPSRVYVHVALGFHVEFTLPEAVEFAETKKSRLARLVAQLRQREAEVRKDLASAKSMIQELRSLADVERG